MAEDFSLADIFVTTIMHCIELTPESAELLGNRPDVSEWIQRVISLLSYEAAAYELGL